MGAWVERGLARPLNSGRIWLYHAGQLNSATMPNYYGITLVPRRGLNWTITLLQLLGVSYWDLGMDNGHTHLI